MSEKYHGDPYLESMADAGPEVYEQRGVEAAMKNLKQYSERILPGYKQDTIKILMDVGKCSAERAEALWPDLLARAQQVSRDQQAEIQAKLAKGKT